MHSDRIASVSRVRFVRAIAQALLLVLATAWVAWARVAAAADGDLDPTFDVDGIVITGMGTGFYQRASDLAIQADGKIVAVGSADVFVPGVTNNDFAVARYNPNGSLDPSFGVGGIVLTNLATTGGVAAGKDEAAAVEIQPDGKIVVAGHSQMPSSLVNNWDIALARYNADGVALWDGRILRALAGPGEYPIWGEPSETDPRDLAGPGYSRSRSLSSSRRSVGSVSRSFSRPAASLERITSASEATTTRVRWMRISSARRLRSS